MPTILRIGPYRFFFFSSEGNEPAHVHIEAGGKEAKIWLQNLRFAHSYGFKPSELPEIARITAEHKEQFEEAWNEYFSRNS